MMVVSPRRYYKRTAKSLGLMLSVTDSSKHREKILALIVETMTTFKAENAIFDLKLFASSVVQIAFPEDSQRQTALLAELLRRSDSPPPPDHPI
jgi:hypothetical protein